MKKNAKAPWKPKFVSCKFVKSSDIFEGLSKAADVFCSSNPPFSWGDNNRTLNIANDIARHLDDHLCGDDETDKQLKVAIRRLRKVGDEYIDLEN